MEKLHRWEITWLRKLLKLRSQPAEGHLEYRRRTKHRIEKWMASFGIQQIHVRVLKAIHRQAWKERTLIMDGSRLLQATRGLMTLRNWSTLKALGRESRRSEFEQIQRGNFTMWEHVMVEAYGLDWTDWLSRYVLTKWPGDRRKKIS